MKSFKDRVAVVTGAGGGIGSEIVKWLLLKDAIVVAIDINPGLLKKLERRFVDFGDRLHTYRVDITDYTSVKELARRVNQEVGKVSFLFNNAGAVHRSLFFETKIEVFRRVLDVNLWGATYMTKVFLRDIIENRGAIEVTSSVAGFAPLYGRTFYSASKYALHGLFETLRVELWGTGVSITIVCPGFTRTPFEQAALGADGDKVRKPRKKVGKYLKPERVGKLIVRAVEREKRLVVVSMVGKLSYFLSRCCPGFYEWLMYRSVRDEFR